MQDGNAVVAQACRGLDASRVSPDEDEQRRSFLLGQHGEEPLQVDGEAGRRHLLAKAPEKVVVASPVGDGESEARGVGFVDRARVVIVASYQTEVENDRAKRTVRLEVAHNLLQVLEGRLRLPHREAFCFLDDGAVRSGTDEARYAPDAGGDALRQAPRKRVD